eukprot:scaffold131_cov335-Pavlova_lutheri.AAC.11
MSMFCSFPRNGCVGASPNVDSDPRIRSAFYPSFDHFHTVFDLCGQKQTVPLQGAYLHSLPFLWEELFRRAGLTGHSSHPFV